jgi:hypothetical protein
VLTVVGISQTQKPFRFEKWWMEIEGFRELVTKNWKQPCPHGKAIDVWQVKLRRLRKFLKGWGININAEQKRKKQALVAEFNCLHIMSETETLSTG